MSPLLQTYLPLVIFVAIAFFIGAVLLATIAASLLTPSADHLDTIRSNN